MSRDNLIFLILAALLLLGMLLTLWWGRGRSRHGYGSLPPSAIVAAPASPWGSFSGPSGPGRL